MGGSQIAVISPRGLLRSPERPWTRQLGKGPKQRLTWGATGHEWIGGIAIEKLPDSVPAFVRTPESAHPTLLHLMR